MYDQTLNFNPRKMGTRPGWCLMNCRLGFGIQRGCFPSAKADMESQKKNKTLHDIKTLPTNCAVPVYCDTVSQYEHVVVCDHGTWYEDGKKIKKPNPLRTSRSNIINTIIHVFTILTLKQ